jgi:hypothetical protein
MDKFSHRSRECEGKGIVTQTCVIAVGGSRAAGWRAGSEGSVLNRNWASLSASSGRTDTLHADTARKRSQALTFSEWKSDLVIKDHSVIKVSVGIHNLLLPLVNPGMPSSRMLRRMDLARTDVSEERTATIIGMIRIIELGTTLAVTSN